MENNALLLILAMLLAPSGSYADGEAAHRHEAMHHDATHHHAMAASGYTRAIVTYNVPDVRLLDANARGVSLHASLGGPEPVLLNFIFTTCTTVCPVMSATFAEAQSRLVARHSKARIVSISIDPEHDTPTRLQEYSKRFDAGPRWSMLTGSIEDSVAVQRAFDVYRGDKMNHEPVTFLRKAPGQPWVRLSGFISADELLHEYDMLAAN